MGFKTSVVNFAQSGHRDSPMNCTLTAVCSGSTSAASCFGVRVWIAPKSKSAQTDASAMEARIRALCCFLAVKSIS